MADTVVLEPQLEHTHARGPRRPPPRTLAAAAILVASAAALPALYLLIRSLDRGPAALLDVLASNRTIDLLSRTALLAVAVTTSATCIAVPVAWLTVRTNLPARRALTVLTSLPLVIPSYVGGYAFVAALGPRGALQSLLAPLGVERLPSIYGFTGAWLVLTVFTYPLVLLPTRAALRGLDPALEEVGRSLGRSPTRVFFAVTLPHLRPAAVSGALLVTLYTISDFGAVSLLRYETFSWAIYGAYRSSFDRTAAATLGLVLVALMLVVLWTEGRTRGRVAYFAVHSGAARRQRTVRLQAWRWLAFSACASLLLVALGIPLSVIGYWTAQAIGAGEPLRVTISAAAHSLQASAVAAAVGVVCAWPVAMLSARYPGRLARLTERFAHAGYALPGIAVALALVFFGIRAVPFAYQTFSLLVFAYVVLFLPQAIGALRASLLQVSPSLEEAARSLGATPFNALRRVVFPLVRPGVLTAWALMFLTAMKELPATLLLAPSGFSTLATQVWNATSAAFFTRAAAPALALVLLSSVPMALLVARERRD